MIPGTQIYCLNGTDPEGQDVRYGLSFDPGAKEYFRIDPKSGNITLVEQLDREVNVAYRWNAWAISLRDVFVFINLFSLSAQKQDSIDVLVSITDGQSRVRI